MAINTYFRDDVSWAGNTELFQVELRGFFADFPDAANGSCCVFSNGKTVKLHLSIVSGEESFGVSAAAPTLEKLVEVLRKNAQSYLNSQRIGKRSS